MKNLIILFLLIFFLLPTSYSLFKECGNFGKCQCGDNLISNHYSSQLDFLNSCSKSHALIINTSNIELNCNGNEITSFINGTQYSGIIISANNVTITNCEIYNFHNAIEIINSSNIEIKDSLLYDNVASGIDIRNSTDIIIKNNTILNNWDGIFTLDSSSIVIENNTIQFNLIDGIHLFYGTHNSIVKNNELSNNDGHAIAPIHCSHTIEDSNFAYGKLVKYYSNDEGLNISNQEFAELILCNINNSIISNLKFNNYEMKTDGILSVNSNQPYIAFARDIVHTILFELSKLQS